MFKKPTIIILIFLAVAVATAVAFKILLKNNIFVPVSRSQLKELSWNGQIENSNMAKKIIRQPAVAGAFYPATKQELETTINGFLANVPSPPASPNRGEPPTSTPKILIVPHAGYPYSGQIAAYAFKQLAGKLIKRAIILGPSHHFPASGLFLSSATHWQTPLGLVKLAEVNQQLLKETNFQVGDEIHRPEHALEVEVPFLQTILPDIEIVPIIVGRLNQNQQNDFANILESFLDSQTILIVSVDLAHYHSYEQNVSLDNQSINDILRFDSAAIINDEIDAPWAVASVLQLAKNKNWQPELIKYANSGDVTGDKSAVVGYGAIGFYGPEPTDELTTEQDSYSAAEKQELLKIARTTLELYFKEGKVYEPQTDNPKFKEKRGVFVTLRKNGQLRGCIGYIEPIKSLLEAVRNNAIAAAVDDERFLPVTAKELAGIEIEISILSVPAPDTLENIIKNRLGVVLQQGSKAATYLPQVWEELPDANQFFSTLCQKAGLSDNCFKDSKTEFSSYQAIVFEE